MSLKTELKKQSKLKSKPEIIQISARLPKDLKEKVDKKMKSSDSKVTWQMLIEVTAKAYVNGDL